MKLKAYAPAKINLGLEIISKRDDNMHNLDMIMQSIDICDEITLEKISDNNIKIKYLSKVNHLPQEDITYKCANLFLSNLGVKNEGLLITINKKIPIAAGLAGGSSDGAAVLLMLNKLYQNPFKTAELMKMAEIIGCDIPFCILGGTARATGLGTTLEKIPIFNDYFLVLVKPNISIFTNRAYKLFDSSERYNQVNFDNLHQALINKDIKNISKLLFNRFEKLINEDVVYNLKKEFKYFLADGTLMSGSGPSVYGIFKNKINAENCFLKMKKKHKEIFLCKPLNHGVEII